MLDTFCKIPMYMELILWAAPWVGLSVAGLTVAYLIYFAWWDAITQKIFGRHY